MNPFTSEEIQDYRSLFPVTRHWAYLNHAAVGPFSLPVAQAIQNFTDLALNEGYTAGPLWQERTEQIREKTAQLIGALKEDLAFVKNTSHGLSLVAQGLSWEAGDEIIISEIEFPANVYPWMALQKKGVILKKIPCLQNELKLEALDSLVTDRTRLIALSSVQYGNGYRLPLSEVGKFCRQKDILFLVDAIQSLGAFPIDVELDQIDFLAADAHKWMLGPEGIGVFYVRKESLCLLNPVLLGWNSVKDALNFDHIDFSLKEDAQRFEEGSLNLLSIYALGAAVDLLLKVGVDVIGERILFLTDRLLDGLDDHGLLLTNSLKPEFRSGIVTFRIPDDSDGSRLKALEHHLFREKIYCAVRRGSLRISPHFYNSEEEINRTLLEIHNFLSKP